MIPPVSCKTFLGLRRKPPALIVYLCVCLGYLTSSARGQGFDATTLREPAELATGWLVHAGDDPAYARPDFDDSNWTPFNAGRDDLHNLFPKSRPEIVWYRLHIKVAPDQKGIALLETGISTAFEVYSNGVELIHAGRIVPFVPYDTSAQIITRIPDDQVKAGSFVIALRVRIKASEWNLPGPGFASSNLSLGMTRTLREHSWFVTITGHAFEWLDYALNVGLLLGGVMLFSTQRNRPEYLWLSFWALAWLFVAPLSLYSLFRTFPQFWHLFGAGVLCFFGLYTVTRMYCAFVGHRVGWALRLFVLATGMSAYFANIASAAGFNLDVQLAAFLPLSIFFAGVIPSIVLRGAQRLGRTERLLLLPVLLIGVGFLLRDFAWLLIQIPAFRSRSIEFISLGFGAQVGPFYLDYNFLSDFLAKLSLALIILIRSNRMSRQQALLETEIASAREVQQVILPEAVQSIPGFRIESIYEPAREVGGDFYQILPLPGGGLILVIGDVAGKGLPAAMLVSVLVGAIRTAVRYDHSPAAVLAQLNERLVGRTKGGFSTALAALIGADGEVTIANAGHLPPYLDGREVEFAGTLPLGILSGAEYETTQIQLEPGSRLTFYSDGVVEAQDKSGQLFGFDRTREISNKPAAAIADAAKAFGQQDDITVITIERAPVQQSHETPKNAPAWAPA